MSHLIIEQGREVGKEISVPVAGMKFGRSPANDLVLDDEAVMLFQGRLFFKSDKALWVTDFSAGKKTTVGGQPIDEHPLKVGDLIEVGETAIRVINTKMTAATPPPQPSDEKIDLGFKPARSTRYAAPERDAPKSATPSHRILQVVVVLLLLLVLALVASQLIDKPAAVQATVQPRKALSLVYECIRANENNIFRYHLELAEGGQAFIKVDDLKSRHISKNRVIPPEAVETLSRRLAATGFFSVAGDRVMESPDQYELYNIAIVRNGQVNQVRILNREPPSEIKATVGVLEEFVTEEMDIPFTLMEEPEALLRYAAESFRLGESRYAERDVKLGNLAEALKHYKETLLYLEVLEPKPELYSQAKKNMEAARAKQDARYKDYMFNVERSIRLGDWNEAQKNLDILAELIPDRSDERYKTISSKQLDVEDHLR